MTSAISKFQDFTLKQRLSPMVTGILQLFGHPVEPVARAVTSGPLAGKQFILYKPLTTIGSSQKCDIYLFKDTSILPQHGTIELRGAQTFLRSDGPIFVSGAPARNRALQSGDLLQIGRYAFHFRERQRN